MEVWKEIANTNDRYWVSNKGRVKSKWQALNPFIVNQYYAVNIRPVKNVAKLCHVHRLVAEAFIPNINAKPQINHKDGNKLNNLVSNLEWCTAQENQQHRITVLGKDMIGEHNPMYGRSGEKSPRFIDYVLQINKLGQVIARFGSILQAAISLNGKTKYNKGASTILKCCKKATRTYKGFYWRYEQEYIGGFKTP